MDTSVIGNYAFPGFQQIEPEHLFGFSKAYNMQLPELKERIKKSVGIITFSAKRLDSTTGEIRTKKFTGTVKKHEEKGFLFCTREPEGQDEAETEIFFRYDNILGYVPCLSEKTNPYGFRHTEVVKDYLHWWRSLHETLSNLPQAHYVVLQYKYSASQRLFRDGNYRIFAKLIKTNGSNLEFWHYTTRAWVSPEDYYANIIPHLEIDRCIAPDRFLSSITVFQGDYHMNPYDEE